MSDYITNVVTLKGIPKRIRNMLYRIKYDNEEIGSIDFNKIIPIPETLKNETHYNNFVEYESEFLCEWTIENWGTEGNSITVPSYKKDTIKFDAICSSLPEPVIKRLSEMYPDITLECAWAGKDFGYNVGKAIFKNGEAIYRNIPNDSKEAIDIAHEIYTHNTEKIQ